MLTTTWPHAEWDSQMLNPLHLSQLGSSLGTAWPIEGIVTHFRENSVSGTMFFQWFCDEVAHVSACHQHTISMSIAVQRVSVEPPWLVRPPVATTKNDPLATMVSGWLKGAGIPGWADIHYEAWLSIVGHYRRDYTSSDYNYHYEQVICSGWSYTNID